MVWLRVLMVLVMSSPAFADDEDARIHAQLTQVEQLLRERGASGVRGRSLDLLHAYIERGVFPRNHERAGWWPHFIDEDGRICAVGYLIEQVGGRAEAERINAAHEWDAVHDIAGIEVWAERLGLTVDELAMIQPRYRGPPPPTREERAARSAQEQQLRGALRAVDMQPCADRHPSRITAFDASVVVDMTGRAAARVSEVVGAEFRQCAIERIEAATQLRRRAYPMQVWTTFHVKPRDERPRGTYRLPPQI